MNAADFDFDLPPELIAQHPAATRAASRLLTLDGATAKLQDRQFSEIVDLIGSRDVVVFNDTKVIKARLFGQKATGGRVEILVERVLTHSPGEPPHALVHLRASKSPKRGARIEFACGFGATMLGRADDLFELAFTGTDSVYTLLNAIGKVPLPPYITHDADVEDESRYQTVYAKHDGSVAAPTAGLHFDQTLLDALASKGVQTAFVTLHVGAGTFRPVRDDDLAKHVMHSECYVVPSETVQRIAHARHRGGRVVAVGTTSVRTLEAASRSGELVSESGETQIFITPGYEFKTVDRLITNFHLPKSTLMMLVAAFAGHHNIMAAYRHAITQRYRFFSYGDAMLLERAT